MARNVLLNENERTESAGKDRQGGGGLRGSSNDAKRDQRIDSEGKRKAEP